MRLGLGLRDQRFGLLGFGQYCSASLVKCLAGVRHPEAAARPLDQAQAQPLLEAGDPPTELGLRLTQGATGGGKAAMRDDFGEIGIVVQINPHQRSSDGTLSDKIADYKHHRSFCIYWRQRRFAGISRRKTMTDRFNNKVVVVTGGSSGIGLAAAKAFSAEGASVFITGRRQEALDAAVKQIGGRVTAVRGDMADLADIDRLYDAVQQQHAQIDVLFANAGGGEMVALGAITEEHYQRTFDTNVKGVLFTVQKALPLLKDGASIVLTSSTTSISGTPAFSVYSATKAAVRNFARNWMLDLKDRHIRVNAISPGVTDTAGLDELFGGGDAGTGHQGLSGRPDPGRPRRPARRDRQGGAVPRLRRRELRQWCRTLRRWRPGPNLNIHVSPEASVQSRGRGSASFQGSMS